MSIKQDRFRFRAWDKSFRRMLYNVLILCFKNKTTVYDYLDNAHKAYLPQDHIVFEQCTGLKDKNGRLIYEGDIVFIADDGYANIKWDNNIAQFAILLEDAYYTFDNIFPTEMEVVGNIHENPELLEEEK